MIRNLILLSTLFVVHVLSSTTPVTPTDAGCVNENSAFTGDDCFKENGVRTSGVCETCFDEDFLREHFDVSSPPNAESNGEVIIEVHNWLGHRVVAQMFRILLEDVYGYKVTTNYHTDPGNSIARVSGGCSHLNPELWGSETSKRVAYDTFKDDGTITNGALGLVGKETLFVPGYALSSNPGVAVYSEILRATDGSSGDVCSMDAVEYYNPDGYTNISAFQSDYSSHLDSFSGVAGTLMGESDGRWRFMPPQCEIDPMTNLSTNCMEVFLADPGWGAGAWYAPVLANLGLNFTSLFTGWSSHVDTVYERYAAGDVFAAYFWSPSTYLAELSMVELVMPEYTSECAARQHADPGNSLVNCSMKRDDIVKIVNTARVETDIEGMELQSLFRQLTLSETQQLEIMRVISQNSTRVDRASCKWLKDNVHLWKDWIVFRQVEDSGSMTHFIVIPIGIFVALAVTIVMAYRSEHFVQTLVAILSDRFLLMVSLSFELVDIISDVLVVVELAEDNEKDGLGDKYLMYYAFFMGLGSFIFACHVAINVLYISRLFFAPKVNNFNSWVETTKKREKAQFKHGLVSRVSFSSLGNKVSPLSEKEKEAAEKKAVEQMSVSDKMKIQLKFLSHANNVRLADSRIQRTMALTALFLFEDLPMGVLNLMIVFDQECSSSNSTNTIVILSLVIGTMMIAFKLSSLAWLPNILQHRLEEHTKSVRLLKALGMM